jgi:hypothetical protein
MDTNRTYGPDVHDPIGAPLEPSRVAEVVEDQNGDFLNMTPGFHKRASPEEAGQECAYGKEPHVPFASNSKQRRQFPLMEAMVRFETFRKVFRGRIAARDEEKDLLNSVQLVKGHPVSS